MGTCCAFTSSSTSTQPSFVIQFFINAQFPSAFFVCIIHSQSSNFHHNVLMFFVRDIKKHLPGVWDFRFLSCRFPIADFEISWSRRCDPTMSDKLLGHHAWSLWPNAACNNPTNCWRFCLRYPRLSVFTCKAITWDISPLPGVSDDDRAESWRWQRGCPTMTELIHGTEGQGSAFSFNVPRCNMEDLNLTRGFRWWQSWFLAMMKAILEADRVFNAELVNDDEEQGSAFGFYMQSYNTGEFTLARGFRRWQSWFMALKDKDLLSVLTCKAVTWEIWPLPATTFLIK